MAKDTARLIAAELLAGVIIDGSYANLLLPRLLTSSTLNQQDRALATELSYGTLRMQGTIDQILEHVSARPLDQLDIEVLIALRLGVYQLLATRIPPHAAVDETVKLVRTMNKSSASGFVNALLRRVARQDFAQWAEQLFPSAEADDQGLGFRTAHPQWIIQQFRASLEQDAHTRGASTDREMELTELLEADNLAPQVNLVVLPHASESDRNEISAATDPLPYSRLGRVLGSGLPGRFRALREGSIRVQDQGSQLVALALMSSRTIESGEQWADMCAGPGGKAALLASTAVQHGVSFLANEINPVRARLVEQALNPIDASLEVRVGDGREFPQLETGFDRIMLDAPCSGIGALRRRPEARWQKTEQDVEQLTQIQKDLLRAGLRSLKPGGILAYVTCSPHLEETHHVLDRVLPEFPEVTELPTGKILQSVSQTQIPGISQNQTRVQLWPHSHGTDAMFLCLVQAPV